MVSSSKEEQSTSGSSSSLRGVGSWHRRSLTASLQISMAKNFKMNPLSGCCSMEKRFKCKETLVNSQQRSRKYKVKNMKIPYLCSHRCQAYYTPLFPSLYKSFRCSFAHRQICLLPRRRNACQNMCQLTSVHH